MFKWIHHILEPHCPDCKAEREESKVCKSCESLLHQLEMANYDKIKLIETISKMAHPEQTTAPAPVRYDPIKPHSIPWKVKQQQLEAEDRKTFQLLKEKQREEELLKNKPATLELDKRVRSVEELEKELGVE